ncbi:hypothetical protein [Sulfurimonas sp.]
MEVSFLIQIVIGLIVVLAILMFFFFSSRSKAKKAKHAAEQNEEKVDLQALLAIIKNNKSTSSELKEALDLVLKHYGEIDNLKVYIDMLYIICLHPNTNKNIIIGFNKELVKLNPKYKLEINGAITDGLNSRGV